MDEEEGPALTRVPGWAWAAYVAAGVAWVAGGDALLAWLLGTDAGGGTHAGLWGSAKDIAFVLVSAALAVAGLRRLQAADAAALVRRGRAWARMARGAEQRQRLATTVVDNAIEGMVVTDANNRILSVNAAFTRLMGYTEAELLGQTPSLFKSGRHDRAFYEALWTELSRTGRWQGEIWNRRKNGEVFPERMSLSTVRDGAGVVTHYVCLFTDISQEHTQRQRQRLAFLAHNDPLTGLPNRTWFAQRLEEATAQARASGESMAVLLLNLDRFKDVNDSYGHAVGDEVLRHIARRLESALRPGDLAGRLAGDEVGVLVRNAASEEEAAAIARTLIAAVAEPWRSPEGFEVVAGASVGISLFPRHGDSAQALLQGAHAAVYGAKDAGAAPGVFSAKP